MDPRYPYGAPPMMPAMGMPMGYPMHPYGGPPPMMAPGGYHHPPPMYPPPGMMPSQHMSHISAASYAPSTVMKPGGITVASAPPRPAAESLSLTVTKIPPSVDDDFLKRVLETTGPVAQWKRGSDPLSGKPLKFGICEYASIEAAARAMRVLNGLSLDSAGSELMLKADEKAQVAMDSYVKRRRMMLNNDAERSASDAAQIEEDDRAKNAARELVQLKNSGQLKPAAAAAPAPPSAPPAVVPGSRSDVSGTIGAKDNGLPSVEKEKLVIDQIRHFREEQQKREQEKAKEKEKLEREKSNPSAAPPAPVDPAVEEAERERRDRERERNRLRDQRERERAAEDRERSGAEKEARERERAIENLERDREREADRRARERQQRLEARLAERDALSRESVPVDPDVILQRGRKRYFESLERERRRRERERERRDDEDDRVKEKQEAEQALLRAQEEEQQRKEKEAALQRQQQEQAARAEQTKGLAVSPISPHSPIAGESASLGTSTGGSGLVIGHLKAAARKRGPIAVANTAFSAADDNEEQWGSGKKRQLQKLDESIATTTQSRNEAAQLTETLNKLLATIPSDKAALFAYQMDWPALDANWPTIEKRLRSWVAKRISEYLGEEEKSLIDFVLSKLKEHSPAADILHQLALVLDEDAEQFMVKLWRLVIFEIMRCTATPAGK